MLVQINKNFTTSSCNSLLQFCNFNISRFNIQQFGVRKYPWQGLLLVIGDAINRVCTIRSLKLAPKTPIYRLVPQLSLLSVSLRHVRLSSQF